MVEGIDVLTVFFPIFQHYIFNGKYKNNLFFYGKNMKFPIYMN